MKSNLLAI
jgi:hypothetical protein